MVNAIGYNYDKFYKKYSTKETQENLLSNLLFVLMLTS